MQNKKQIHNCMFGAGVGVLELSVSAVSVHWATGSTNSTESNTTSTISCLNESGSKTTPLELACFVFNEQTQLFVFWGTNLALLLVR